MALDWQRFSAEVCPDGDGHRLAFTCRWPDVPERHAEVVTGRTQQHFLDLFARLAEVYGTRLPRNRQGLALPPAQACHRPLLTENLPGIRYGYGDPCVIHDAKRGEWLAVVTSNDAPDSFPILRSPDLAQWELATFAFPRGHHPAWAMTQAGQADFWAPELHKVGERYLLCFAAREHDGTMAIAVASAASPIGPFRLPERPLLRGGAIDAHLFVPADGDPILFWKEDSNALWPELLADLLGDWPDLAAKLFDAQSDQRTAAVSAALWPAARDWPPMERFFVLQPLIEAVTSRFAAVRMRFAERAGETAGAILSAMETRIFAQDLAPDGSALRGERRVVLVNDQRWEAHLIEGPWLTAADGRYFLFYSGNDFSTHDYGIGVAVADDPKGPFRKQPEPLLRSDAAWIGPGHPSVGAGPDGLPQLFYHAYHPGHGGYNTFRALLTARLNFTDGRVQIGC